MSKNQQNEHDMYDSNHMDTEGSVYSDTSGLNTVTGEEASTDDKANKDKKLKMMLFGGLAILGTAWLGYKYAFPTQPNLPKNQTSMLSEMNTPKPGQEIQANGQAMGNPSMNNGMGTPNMGAPTNPPQNAGMMDNGMNNPASLAQNTPPAPVQPVQPAQPQPQPTLANNVDPMGVKPEVKGSAPMTAPVAVQEPAPVNKTEGLNRGFDEIIKKMDDVKAMLDKLSDMNIGDRLAKLEARVNAMESGKFSGAKHSSNSNNSVKSYAPRKVVVHKEVKQVITPLSRQEGVFTKSNALPEANSISKISNENNSVKNYSLHAIIPGRIWIKDAEGVSRTFEKNEELPNGAKVLKIDAEKGEVTTSKGLLKFGN